MGEARSRAEWERTADLMALIANCNRDPSKRRRAYAREDFLPMPTDRRRRREGVTQASAAEMRSVMTQRMGLKVQRYAPPGGAAGRVAAPPPETPRPAPVGPSTGEHP